MLSSGSIALSGSCDFDLDVSPCSTSNSTDDLKHTNAIDLLRSLSATSSDRKYDYPNSLLYSEKRILDQSLDEINSVEDITYECDGRYSDHFKDRETHFFILSQSGKPIFSRYGTDNQTAAFIGVMQAMVSYVESGDDKLKVMIAGKHTFVFLVRDNIILVAVTSGAYVPSQLRMILNQIYYQIISMLTFRTISTAFIKQPSLDLRRLLVGIDRYMHSIIEHMEGDIGPLLKAVTFVTMDNDLRMSMINTVSQSMKVKDVVFALILLDEQLVAIVRRKGYYLHPMDTHLILNLIRNSVHFNSQICWLPICLPRFDPDGYFYAHVSYIVPRLSLVILTVNAEQFDVLQDSHNSIRHLMIKEGLTKHIESLNPVDKLWHSFKLRDVRHFVCKIRTLSQYISYSSSKLSNAYNSKIVVGRYLPLHRIIHRPERHGRLVYQNTGFETVLAWQTKRFELYATLEHMNSKYKVMETVTKLLKTIDMHKDNLFVMGFPTF